MKPTAQETIAVMKRVFEATEMTGYALTKKLAEMTGRDISTASIYGYRDGLTIPDYLVVAMSELTEEKVQPHEIRPDVFPAPGEKLPRPANAQPTS